MTPTKIRMVRLAYGSCLATLLCMTGCISNAPESGGIHFDQPVEGARETYVRFTYGGVKMPEAVKTYTQEFMSLEITKVQDNSMTFSQKWCYAHDSACTTMNFTVDRTTGHVDVLEADGWSELEMANQFSFGIFTDSTRIIEFTEYVPKVESPSVGIAPEYRLGGKSYRDVTVMVDPTGIPMDGGGQVLVLSMEKRLIELYRYHVFGIDGGWEMRD